MFRIIAHLTASICFVSLLSGPLTAQELPRLLFTPSETISLPLANGKKIYVVGYVQAGSLKRSSNAAETLASFSLAYSGSVVRVMYNGILPDLISEGNPALVEGILEVNGIKASSILVSLDDNYLPESVLGELRSLGLIE